MEHHSVLAMGKSGELLLAAKTGPSGSILAAAKFSPGRPVLATEFLPKSILGNHFGGPILVRQSNYKWRKGGIGAEAPLMSLKGQTINYKLYILKIDRYSLIEQSKSLIEQTAHKALSCIYPPKPHRMHRNHC